MRGAKNKTPKATKLSGANNGVIGGRSASKSSAEKQSSAKKLVQARLPFKIFPADEGRTSKTETRKRKLSYDNESDQKDAEATEDIKENLGEGVGTGNNRKKPKTAGDKANDTKDIVVVVLDDSSSDAETASPAVKIKPKASKLQTPKATVNNKTNKGGAGTPKQMASSEKKRTPRLRQSITAPGKETTSPQPTSVTKSKRRKFVIRLKSSLKKQAEDEQSEASDTIEEIAENENPHKRIKFAATDNESTTSKSKVSIDIREKEKQKADKTKSDGTNDEEKPVNEETNESVVEEKPEKSKVKITTSAKEEVISQPEVTTSVEMMVLDTSVESTEETEGKSEEKEKNNTNGANTIAPTKETLKATTETTNGKNLTPKQQKLREQWRKAREEKELKLQEEKQQRQQEKEEREQAKKREREEREEQKRKEREEKEEQRRKEREEKDELRRKEREEKDEQKRMKREEKERERLAEQEVKNEEKRKKDQEKEEAEQKKKRAAQAFTKFFVQKSSATAATRDTNAGELPQQVSNADVNLDGKLAFQPFQIKGDMKLAPITRKLISTESRGKLDENFRISDEVKNQAADDKESHIVRRKSPTKAQLYLNELASGKLTPGKWIRASPEATDDDVVILEDDIERLGQAIVEEHKLTNERLRAKYFKFHENQRPPYYGTWRKKTNIITPRRPFVQDTKYLDYEVDSDLEWEEEEPGESLDGSEDEKDKESDEDDYEVDNECFVPHGHLSDEELQNDDDDANTREAQKAKLQILQQEFAQEMRKATKQIKPRLIGCMWVDEYGNKPEDCPNIIWETLNKRAMLCTHAGIKLEPIEPAEPTVFEVEVRPLVLTADLQRQLVRLVHGNSHSKSFLVAEFLAYLHANVEALKAGESLPPYKTMLREKIDECAKWKAVELVATVTPPKNASKKQKKTKKRLCWVVADEVLQRLQLTELTLSNNWPYTLPSKFSKSSEPTQMPAADDNDSDETSEQNLAGKGSKKPVKAISKNGAGITKFAKVIVSAKNKAIDGNDANAVESGTLANLASTDAKAADTLPAAMASEVSEPNVSLADANESSTTTSIKSSGHSEKSSTNTTPTVSASTPAITKKKRVPLLMSVGRGEQIPLAKKNALISQFLNKNATSTATGLVAKQTVISNDVVADIGDDVIMLD